MPEIDTTPFYPRPHDDDIREATRLILRVADYVAPGSYAKAELLVRAVIFHGPSVAASMWAIHELTVLGGVTAYQERDREIPRSRIVTSKAPPAGLAIATGVLHINSGDVYWSYLCFELHHQRIAEIRSSLPPLSDTTKSEPRKWPDNPDVRDLCAMLAQREPTESLNAIARKLTGELAGKCQKADSLLRQARRYRHLWDSDK